MAQIKEFKDFKVIKEGTMTFADIISLKPDAFKIVKVKSVCEGCIFLIKEPDRICKVTRDLDLMDLMVDIDVHFGINCYKKMIVYKLRKP
jgi:hypothetical protein